MTATVSQLAALAADTGRTIASVNMIAAGPVRATLVTWGFPSGSEAPRDETGGVTRHEWRAWPATLLWRPSEMLDETHAEALATAWMMGAWDVSVWSFTAVDCRVPHTPWALGDDDVDDIADHGREAVRLAAEAEGMTKWDWRPMAFAPELRRRKWLARDATLRGDGTRDVADLPQCGSPVPVTDVSRQHIITFGLDRR